MTPRNVGELILSRLKKLGVEYFFANPGTEFASIIRGFAELPSNSIPIPVLAAHEAMAVNMAYGHFLVSGKPQAVMTHANVGAANALIGLIGASRMNIPLIFFSGMTSRSERETLGHRNKLIHWSQDARDQGEIFREYTKWDAMISDPSTAADILDRAYAIATSEPFGPVAIGISRDVLMSAVSSSASAVLAMQSHSKPSPDPTAIERVVKWLVSAQKPLVITNRLGANPVAVTHLIRLAENQGLGVITPDDFYVSFPSDHPNHLGYSQSGAIREADLLLVLDTEAPWFPLEKGPAAGTKIVHVGPDPLFQGIPLKSHRGDLFIQSDPLTFLLHLEKSELNKPLLPSRQTWIASKKRSPATPVGDGLTAETTSAVLSEFLGPETLLINELGLVPDALKIKHPGTYFRSGAASPLGWGVGCALGLSLADRKRMVIAAIGDGVFYLSPMLAALLASVELDCPFVTLVLNNGGMNSISKTVREFYPASWREELPLTSFGGGSFELERCASTVGGLGIKVSTQLELRRGLQEAIEFAKRERKPAVVNVIMGG